VDDASLIRGTLAGRRADFDVLVERYHAAVLGFVIRLVRERDMADDIVQSTFLRAYTRLGQFRGEASFASWLYQIALNETRSRRRRDKAHLQVALDEVDEADLGSVDHSDSPGLRSIQGLVARLPLRQRSVLLLRVLRDLPFKEIARIEGISENSAKVNYHHAVVRLRAWLKESSS
jgi:RNA polymerase sigma-70 factor (ECF subfamily)